MKWDHSFLQSVWFNFERYFNFQTVKWNFHVVSILIIFLKTKPMLIQYDTFTAQPHDQVLSDLKVKSEVLYCHLGAMRHARDQRTLIRAQIRFYWGWCFDWTVRQQHLFFCIYISNTHTRRKKKNTDKWNPRALFIYDLNHKCSLLTNLP